MNTFIFECFGKCFNLLLSWCMAQSTKTFPNLKSSPNCSFEAQNSLFLQNEHISKECYLRNWNPHISACVKIFKYFQDFFGCHCWPEFDKIINRAAQTLIMEPRWVLITVHYWGWQWFVLSKLIGQCSSTLSYQPARICRGINSITKPVNIML